MRLKSYRFYDYSKLKNMFLIIDETTILLLYLIEEK